MNSTYRAVLSLLCLGLLNLFVAGAQESPVLSPQAIIVNPVPSYEVEVFVDKDPSGEALRGRLKSQIL